MAGGHNGFSIHSLVIFRIDHAISISFGFPFKKKIPLDSEHVRTLYQKTIEANQVMHICFGSLFLFYSQYINNDFRNLFLI